MPFEVIEKQRGNGWDGVATVTVGKNGTWYLNKDAYALLGYPLYVMVMYDAETGRGGIRRLRDGEPEMHGYSVSRAPTHSAGYFNCRPLAKRVSPARERITFEVTAEDGMLVFGGKEE
jgi:hypothetical protein